MIELMVVVGIIIVLLGLIVSVAQRTIESSKQRQAKIILTVLDNAIQEFASEEPLSSWTSQSGALAALGLNPDDYTRDFGSFPPHYDWYAEGTAFADGVREMTLGEHPVTSWPGSRANLFRPNVDFFSRLGGMMAQDSQIARHAEEFNDANALNPQRYDLENSENLYFFLTQLNPAAKALLDALPEGTLTNTDIYTRKSGAGLVQSRADSIDLLGDSNPGDPRTQSDDLDLFEIRDPWGNVISYWVYYFIETPGNFNGQYEPGQGETLVTAVPVLESAGPDGKFGHRPGIGIDPTTPNPLDDQKALADNVFSRQPPWK